MCSLLVVGLCGLGIMNVQIESDPVKLWVPPDIAKFYRISQLIITSSIANFSILEAANLLTVQQIQTDLASMRVPYTCMYCIASCASFAPIFLIDFGVWC
jgi:hypothetical protein